MTTIVCVQAFVFELYDFLDLTKNSSRTIWFTIIHITCLNSGTWVTCVYNPAAADAKCNVVDMSTTCIENQVTGSCAGWADFFLPTPDCAPEVRGKLIPNFLNTDMVNPEQSVP